METIDTIKNIIIDNNLDLRYYDEINKNYDFYYHISEILNWDLKKENLIQDINDDLIYNSDILNLIDIIDPNFENWMLEWMNSIIEINKQAIIYNLEQEILEILEIIKEYLKENNKNIIKTLNKKVFNINNNNIEDLKENIKTILNIEEEKEEIDRVIKHLEAFESFQDFKKLYKWILF